LIMGGNLTKMDDWTSSLLTNEEVLAVDQHSAGGREIANDGSKAVWMAKADTRNAFYIALFNLTDAPQTITYPLQSISMSRTSGSIRDLWEHKDLGVTDILKAQLPPHACALFQLRP
jgi:alpha-galactosidase